MLQLLKLLFYSCFSKAYYKLHSQLRRKLTINAKNRISKSFLNNTGFYIIFCVNILISKSQQVYKIFNHNFKRSFINKFIFFYKIICQCLMLLNILNYKKFFKIYFLLFICMISFI